MYALVESGTITKYFNHPKGFTLGDLQYPADLFMKWSVEEKEAIGIYEVVFDNSNKKDEQWYINTNQTFAFANDTVTASYGTAFPKAHADVTETVDGVEYTTPGLKTNLIKDLKTNVANELARTDWYITRKTEKSTAIPSAISTHRDAVRTKQASMETAITNAVDTPALETLHTYTTTDGVQSRPLGELPVLES
jgi:argininosuccinate lyase